MPKYAFCLFFLIPILSCSSQTVRAPKNPTSSDGLPEPYATKSTTNYSDGVGWKGSRTPKAPEGFVVTKYADGFDNPRWLCLTPWGDVLVAESNSNHSTMEKLLAPFVGANKSNNMAHSADRITWLGGGADRAWNGPRGVFIDHGLNQPFGMLFLGDWFYVGDTNALLRFPLVNGRLTADAVAEKVADLPAGEHNRHWTRNIVASADGSKIYVGVGSGSNAAEFGISNEVMRARILEMNPDGSDLRVYASGLRNPVGMDWEPATGALWSVVNERDELGDDLVPDYFTHVVRGAFYGWPYSYWGGHLDPRVKEKAPDAAGKAILPDLNMGNHHAPLGLSFYRGTSFPAHYRGGAFIAEHGSWNSKVLEGYKVVFIPFKDGRPSGPSEDFLTGFNAGIDQKTVYGRPVGLLVLGDGSLLVTDDLSNTIWKVRAVKP